MKWYEKIDDSSPIISCRLRLARNLKKYPFLCKLERDQAKEMIENVKEAILPRSSNFTFTSIPEKTRVERSKLLEHHKISLDVARTSRPCALISSVDDHIHILLNEEDHIRIQSIAPGRDIESVYKMANYTDDLIEETLEYAFHENYGYLTSCPSNTGTGMRASFMLHLPLLEEQKSRMEELTRSLASLGMTVRGIHGENSSSQGSIFQVSNQITLGKPEEELLKSLEKTVDQLVQAELDLIESKLEDDKSEFEDTIYRAYGTLKYAKKISLTEARKLLSTLRMGIISGIFTEEIKTPIYKIMMNIDFGSLRTNFTDMDYLDIDPSRAAYIRENL
ncbi:MAG: ATP--guanido phosphotransferase [Defluviitaleaceae bacterium]|nr:ATP--guanido phosphotransferase [Defluviitaleaceae bacterium]